MAAFAFAGMWGPTPFTDTAGNALVGAKLTVYTDAAMTLLATLYVDQTKAATAFNPANPDSLGNFSFFAVPGIYYGKLYVGATFISNTTHIVQPWPADLLAITGAVGPAGPGGPLDTSSADLRPESMPAVAGATGKSADAGHVHPYSFTRTARPPQRPVIISSGVGSTTLPATFGNAGLNYTAGILTWASSQPSVGGAVDVVSAIPSPLTDQSLQTQYQACATAEILGMVTDLGVQINPTFDQSGGSPGVEQMKDYVGNVWTGVAGQHTGAGVWSARHWGYVADYITKLVAAMANPANNIRVPDGSALGRSVRMIDYTLGFKIGGLQNNEPRYANYGDADPSGCLTTSSYVPTTNNPVLSNVVADGMTFANNPAWGTTGPILIANAGSATGAVLSIGTITGNSGGAGTASNVHDLVSASDGYPHTYASGANTWKLASIWAYSSLPQTGTNASGDTLPAGMTVAPIAGYIPYIGTNGNGTNWSAANDAAFWAWYQGCLNQYVGFILTTLANALIANNAPSVILWVSHPDLGLRQTPVIANSSGGSSTNTVMQPGLAMLAEGLDTASLMRVYGKSAGFPYPVIVAPNCTGFDQGFGGVPTSALTMPTGRWMYQLAAMEGVAGYIIGEDTGGGSSPNAQQIFGPGGALTDYFGYFAAVGTTPGTAQLTQLSQQAQSYRAPIAALGTVTPNDYNLISYTMPPDNAQLSNLLSASGVANGARLHVPYNTTCNFVHIYLTVGGGTLTLGDSFVAVYALAVGGTNPVLIGQSADQAVSWASTGAKKIPIIGTPPIVAGSDLWVVLWSVGTTMPTLQSGGTIALVNINLTASQSKYFTANSGLTTVAPASLTLSGLTQANAAFWFGVSDR